VLEKVYFSFTIIIKKVKAARATL